MGGKTPSCTPRGARWAEFNLEQPYVLWCSLCTVSAHATERMPGNECALSRREPRWLRSNLQFTIVSSLGQVSAAFAADRPMTRFHENSTDSILSFRHDKRNSILIYQLVIPALNSRLTMNVTCKKCCHNVKRIISKRFH